MRHFLKYLFLFLILCQFSFQAQSDSLRKIRTKKIIVGGGSALVTTGSLLYLNQVWYSQYNSGKFHFFNDGDEWLQMDKVGHLVTNFQLSRYMMDVFNWAGFSKKKQMWIGGTMGFAYMTVVEVMDGYSTGWGFSWQDVGYNAIGTAAAIGQKALWNEQRLSFKFSFHTTSLAKYNPELLGAKFHEQILKDYNGQTYWLSVSPFAFCKADSKLPKWLAVSFGYGADGMLGARYNDFLVIDEEGFVKSFDRVRQYYISLDIDFTKIKTKSKFLKAVFNSINLLKFPMPTLEIQSGGKAKFHYLYF